jgi:hypothetical protein
VGGHERTWGFVISRPGDLEDELDPQTYETRTRGVRVLPVTRQLILSTALTQMRGLSALRKAFHLHEC